MVALGCHRGPGSRGLDQEQDGPARSFQDLDGSRDSELLDRQPLRHGHSFRSGVIRLDDGVYFLTISLNFVPEAFTYVWLAPKCRALSDNLYITINDRRDQYSCILRRRSESYHGGNACDRSRTSF